MAAGRGLESRLVSSGALRREAVQMARRRQKVYGGGLDTVLLEMGLVDEGTLWALLVEETALPPLPPALLDGPVVEPDVPLSAAHARHIGAFIFRLDQAGVSRTQAVARPGYDAQAVLAALQEEPGAELFIVPEVRFEALMGSFYGQPVPPRFLSLLGRLMGAEQVRRWAATRAPRPTVVKAPVDVGPRFATPRPKTPPPVEAPIITAAVAENDVGQDIEAAIDRLAAPQQAAPGARRPNDELLAALELLAELDGGPRAPALATAVLARWSCAEIFSRLPQLARRGESAAAAALPLLSARPENTPLLMQWLQAENPRERAWAALALEPFVKEPATREALCTRIERELNVEVRLAMARALRPVAKHEEVQALVSRLANTLADTSALDPARANAAALIGQLRPAYAEGLLPLIGGLAAKSQQVASTCRGLLVRITGHDAGKSPGPWRRWWQAHQEQPREAWLIEGLGHKQADVRIAAASELWELTGQTLGYHFDLPPAARKAALARWKIWLQEGG